MFALLQLKEARVSFGCGQRYQPSSLLPPLLLATYYDGDDGLDGDVGYDGDDKGDDNDDGLHR